jgi:hypothetical protein
LGLGADFNDHSKKACKAVTLHEKTIFSNAFKVKVKISAPERVQSILEGMALMDGGRALRFILNPPPLLEGLERSYRLEEDIHRSFSLLAQRKRTKRKGALSLGPLDFSALLERSGAQGNSLRSNSPRA